MSSNAFQDFIQFYGSNSDREVMKVVAWEIINLRILNDDSQETCGRWDGLSMVRAWLVVVLCSWEIFPRTQNTLLSWYLLVMSPSIQVYKWAHSNLDYPVLDNADFWIIQTWFSWSHFFMNINWSHWRSVTTFQIKQKSCAETIWCYFIN